MEMGFLWKHKSQKIVSSAHIEENIRRTMKHLLILIRSGI